jgi:hypothetical protein
MPETCPTATSCAATSATRHTRRTRVGSARRGAGVTIGHCAAPAGAQSCRPWQVGPPGGVDPPDGAPPVARYWPPERRTSPAIPRPLHVCASCHRDLTGPQPTSCAHKTLPPAAPRAHARPPQNLAVRHWRRRCEPRTS